MTRLLATITLAAALLLPTAASWADAPDPLANQTRWQVQQPYVVMEGRVIDGPFDLNPTNGTYWIRFQTDDGAICWAKFYPGIGKDGSTIREYSRIAIAGPLVLDTVWLNAWGGPASDWLEIVPVQNWYEIAPPQLPTALDVTLNQVDMGAQGWLHVLVISNRTGQPQRVTLFGAPTTIDASGYVRSWLASERHSDAGEFVK